MRITIMLALTLGLLSGHKMAAQDSSLALQPGQVIRVSGPRNFRFTGEFVGGDSESLVIRPNDGQARRVPLAWISKVEIRTGHTSKVGTGALIGASAGALVGASAVAGLDNMQVGLGGDDGCCSEGDYAGGALAFAAIGAGVGALIGAVSHKDAWVRVPAEVWHSGASAPIDSQDLPVAEREKKRDHPLRP
ncbi:MAG TPA: hypothetical protein VLA89_07775 [Gemmatimonadales bacterium]|nr:hypothetical protein [Gemmatimonadales bacterium]